ncbi:MAG: phosphoribosyltransferase family protein [Planctomycetota bacterium]|nr:phosphoribosyltransferase family protein [Planctomycetota bacterium]
MAQILHVSWSAIDRQAEDLAAALRRRPEGGIFDRVIAVSRGGLVPAALLAAHLGVRRVESVQVQAYDGTERLSELRLLGAAPVAAGPSGDPRQTLVVDEMCDSGRTGAFLHELLPQACQAALVGRGPAHDRPQVRSLGGGGQIWLATSVEGSAWLVFPWSPAEDRLGSAGELGAPPFRRFSTEDLVASRPPADARASSRLPVIVALDNIRSAMNVGLVFRVCDCVNVEALWLGGITAWPGVSEHATNRIGKTAVGGSLESVPWRHVPDLVPEVARLKAEGWRVVALEQGSGSQPWRAVDYGARTVLILGHEREGVQDPLLELADAVAELPVRGITNSLNVATCASAVLYELLDRHEGR